MKTLTVLSRKGGAGKTTVSLSLALAAKQAGLKVVVADIDPLRSAGEVLRSRDEAVSLLFETTAAKLFILQDACRRNGCDLLIIDTPTGPEGDILLAVNMSDHALVVARPTSLDLAAVRESITLVRRIGCPGLVVLNQCPPLRNGAEPSVVDDAVQRLQFGHIPVAKARLRSRMGYQHAFAHNCSVTEWDPSSEAAADVLRLLAEVSDRLVLPAGADRASSPETRPALGAGPAPIRLMQTALKRLSEEISQGF
jgi:chromosome partitioning protein